MEDITHELVKFKKGVEEKESSRSEESSEHKRDGTLKKNPTVGDTENKYEKSKQANKQKTEI